MSKQLTMSNKSNAAHPLPVEILAQPNDETCGPTCVHAVYRFWGDEVGLDDVLASVHMLDRYDAGRGTMAVLLGIDARKRGYDATLYTFNLNLFDPTWFDDHGEPVVDLSSKLEAQAEARGSEGKKFRVAMSSFVEFLRLGGEIRFADLTSRLISGFIRNGRPVLTGLSATYLYRSAREYGPNDDYIRGEPAGHFVILHGYDPKSRAVTVADPLADNPGFGTQQYSVPMARLVPSIMLGVLTYDSNLLVIEPGNERAR